MLGLLLATGSLNASLVETVKKGIVAPFESPDEQAWGSTFSFGDSDRDAVYALHRGWFREFGERGLEYGWEIGGGIANSGKRNTTGAFVYLDLLVRAGVFDFGWVEVNLGGLAGIQLQSIRVPGMTHNNFRLGAFLDWEREIGERDWFLRTGYLHISNANVGGGNEGHDAWWAGAGFRW